MYKFVFKNTIAGTIIFYKIVFTSPTEIFVKYNTINKEYSYAYDKYIYHKIGNDTVKVFWNGVYLEESSNCMGGFILDSSIKNEILKETELQQSYLIWSDAKYIKEEYEGFSIERVIGSLDNFNFEKYWTTECFTEYKSNNYILIKSIGKFNGGHTFHEEELISMDTSYSESDSDLIEIKKIFKIQD